MPKDGIEISTNNFSSDKTDQTAQKEPIAIIGIGCRFPGAKGPDAFWRLMRDGVDAITEVPRDRFDVDLFYDPTPGTPGKLCTRYGGFLQDVDKFDPYFFGISPREAIGMDPQQRLLLEVAWEALEDAGQVPAKLAGSKTGVFVGMCSNDYGHLIEDPAEIDIYFAGGNTLSILSGRISYVLGFQGPSMSLDTACSTSLVAVHLACKSLWMGESTLALAGGVNLIILPVASFSFSRTGMLATDGRCKFGDASADGFIRSDGVGVVVLKPLSQAISDRDPIYALIRGSAVNNDGRSGGLLMQPSPVGQEEVLREAYQNAGVSPRDMQYIEAHGTGTSVGDPIELEALGKVLAEGRPKDHPCIVGSVKTNIGHTEGASGVAGLIKAALSLKHRTIPPSLHFHSPNPNIPWEKLPLVVQKELGSWPDYSNPALAGVSSFGISGTNAHVVLEEVPTQHSSQDKMQEAYDKPYIFTLSAHTPESLEAMVRSYQEFLSPEGKGRSLSLRDVCYTASVRRTHHDFRLTSVVHSHEELSEHLEAFLTGENRRGLSHGQRISSHQHKLVFVCSPTGAQWQGMARELFENEAVFRESIEECDRLFRGWVNWSLIDELKANEERSRLNEVDVMQPIIFALQVALSSLWHSWGIEPDAVVGHSMGEVAAAHIAGVLSLEDAVRIICRRSQLVRQKASGRGGMAVIELPVEEVEGILADYNSSIYIASCNGPTTTVVSGEPNVLKELKAILDNRGIFCQIVKVDYASHSPHMEVLRADLIEALREIQPRPASLRMLSTVTLQPIEGPECDELYWMRNLREPVYFFQAVNRLLEEGHNVFIELSPHPLLSMAISQALRKINREGTVLSSMRRLEEERGTMLASLGTLYSLGYPIDWNRLYPSRGKCVQLPSYIWQKERFWVEDKLASDGTIQKRSYNSRVGRHGHPLLGQQIKLAANPGTRIWEMELGTNLIPYLNDHRVQGMAVLPATAYLEIVLAAAVEAFGSGPHALEDVAFKKALFLPENGACTVQLVLSSTMPGKASFQFFSLETTNGQQSESWTLHATGTVHLNETNLPVSVPDHKSPENIQSRCPELISSEQLYQAMERCEIQYGPSFRGVERIWGHTGEAIGQIRLPEILRSRAAAYQVHPVLLDASFQVIFGTQLNGGREPALYMPVGLESLRVYSRYSPDSSFWSHTIQRENKEENGKFLMGDIYLLDEGGRVLVEAIGLRAQRLDSGFRQGVSEKIEDLIYDIKWNPKDLSAGQIGNEKYQPSTPGSWLIFIDKLGIGKELADILTSQGERCLLVSPGKTFKRTSKRAGIERFQIHPTQLEDMKKLIETAIGPDRPPCRGIIHLWGLNRTPPKETTLSSLEESYELGCFSLLHLVQTYSSQSQTKVPRLLIITSGAQAVGKKIESVSVAESPLWGLGRIISLECPQFRCKNVDLSQNPAHEEVKFLFWELWSEDKEDQIALRGHRRYVPRLSRWSSEFVEEKRLVKATDQPYRLEIDKPGILDNLTLRAISRKSPGPGEIEIEVLASGLNFRDVLIALGLVPPVFEGSLDLGWECSGRISAVGKGIEDYNVGDEVIAVAPGGSFGSYVTIPVCPSSKGQSLSQQKDIEKHYSLVVRKPSDISFEEASTIPIVFTTAYYALCRQGGLRKGERVLIHAAAGGVGQAAVQIASHIGAEIFATAGSPEKREFLKSQGVQHVMNSRTLDFAEEVMKLTNGEGVDLVLNSLAGEFIPKSLSTLRSGGRFLEIGKVDILKNSQLGLGQLEKNISLFIIDLGQLFLERPDLTQPLFREVMRYFEEGGLKPLPYHNFPISQAADAFRFLAQAKHIGKVVLSLSEDELWLAPPSSKKPLEFSQEATYLIAGGLGGLGLTVAEWMIEKGAKNLVLMGRSGASSNAAKEAVERMKNNGARVVVARANISDEEQVSGVLDEIKQTMPSLKGIIHTAAVLDDGILIHLNQERFKKVMAPKVKGAWNLHALTLDEELDFFVLFSSGASVLASPGQGTYVTANSFLDALAHHRRALDLPATTINWGLWSEVGLAARPEIMDRLMKQGIMPLTPKQGIQLLERIIEKNPIQVMPASIDWSRLLKFYTTIPPMLSYLAEEVNLSSSAQIKGERDGIMREKLLAAPPEERSEMLESYIQEQVAKVLRIPPSRLDREKSLMNTGLDSLMALELKNRIESNLAIDLPVTNLIKGPSIKELAAQLLDQLTVSSWPTQLTDGYSEQVNQILEEIERLSEDEVRALLAQEEKSIQESNVERRVI